MQVIDNLKIKEKLYVEKLENGLTVMIIPKKGVQKKYIVWGTNYGSNDSEFVVPGESEATVVPKGVAHFLEHKMFEQENGRNSLDVLTALGVSANAYTTNDHTAYLFECVDNFYPALDELMDYVQHPYFTDENVEKEKGIIGQEIMMYDDYPEWRVYLNALEAMYHEHPVKLDITGTIETISHIDKEVLYKCYNTFYNPSNMTMAVCGDFDPEELLNEIKSRLVDKEANGEIKRIYPNEPDNIVKKEIEQKMDVTIPLYIIGFKMGKKAEEDKVKRHIAIEILLNLLFGESSILFKKLYDSGNVFAPPGLDYEFSTGYGHVLLTGKSNDPKYLYEEFKKALLKMKQEGINKEDFIRIKKMIYGKYVRDFDDVEDIARMFMSDSFKGINSFDYIDEISNVDICYVEKILNEDFNFENMVISVVKK